MRMLALALVMVLMLVMVFDDAGIGVPGQQPVCLTLEIPLFGFPSLAEASSQESGLRLNVRT
eukprot:4016271-Lingulodinium_polyedra.AAC.1